jgi:hypothetical protein
LVAAQENLALARDEAEQASLTALEAISREAEVKMGGLLSQFQQSVTAAKAVPLQRDADSPTDLEDDLSPHEEAGSHLVSDSDADEENPSLSGQNLAAHAVAADTSGANSEPEEQAGADQLHDTAPAPPIEHEAQLPPPHTPEKHARLPPSAWYMGHAGTDFGAHVNSDGDMAGLEASGDFVVSPTGCCGYLVKQGNVVKSWNRRWFVLSLQQQALTYYQDRTERAQKGRILLSTMLDVCRNSADVKQAHFVYIVTPGRMYTLEASNCRIADLWTRALRSILPPRDQ